MDSRKEGNLVETQFLKPYVTSIDGAVAELPRHCLRVSSSDLKESFSRISFNGFWSARADFKSWAKKMEALHEPTWRKAGIFEAIKASTYKIPKNDSLVLALVEKWCPETKSFVFPWGEATITLEDVLVLLGFSVLGSPVFAPLESSEMGDSVEKLEKARFEKRGRDGQTRQGLWVSSFLGRGDQMEHEAFLVMWLSQLVFPDMSRRSISRKVLPIAVRLARGERIALAPAVLARLYSDLGQILAFARDKSAQNLTLRSLFKLVQVWAWERFENTRPRVGEISKGEPRIARWVYSQQTSENVRLNLDDFDWRPYTKPLKNWNPPRFYPEEAMWMTADDNLDDEFVSYARCMRVSHLVGMDIVEDYYPNRVARQFGLAQDLPGLITDQRSFTEKEAWDDYNKSLDGLKLYLPSCLAPTSVTERYQDWWFKSISKFLIPSESTETFNASNTIDDDDDVQPLGQVFQKLGESFLRKFKRFKTRRLAKNLRFKIKKDKIFDSGASASTELPLSQLFKEELIFKRTSEHLRNKRSKRAREDDESTMDHKDDEKDDDITIAQISKSRTGRTDKSGSKANKSMVQRPSNENNSSDPPVDSHEDIIKIAVSPPETRLTCDDKLHVNGTKEEEGLVHEDGEKQRCNENLRSEAEKEEDIDERLKQRKLSIKEIELKLETRIMKVEKSLAMIRIWKTRRNQTNNGVCA
ncbi:hypothetical protein CARUB_v10010873mg [Capsella rubella]|uniref:Aminotransferase-like plant mobile domain-containing protein n=1 Tax=Capsella rubella TaxID=81985 RepID=R0GMU3_9BRAS|nr:uncharacterized protein LOC17899901 [Capsella rubella]EOA37277.1 hypothetical protein CARUB_v10010873mg [Capsella rubella]